MKPTAAAATRALFGAAFILLALSAVLAGYVPISTWTTPICWWGYLLILDALLEAREGASPFVGRPRRFAAWTILSILFWLPFEAYNLRLRNWEYVGLPDDPWIRAAGYAVSFATILPGLFLTSAALRSFGLFARSRCRPWGLGRRGERVSMAAGALCLIVPPLLPGAIGRWLFAPVWIGLILLLEPLNARRGRDSLLDDLRRGEPGRALRLMTAGLICGVLWEWWNFGAAAKWIYHVPYFPSVRLFEMPVAGFLGFAPFALEYYALYRAAAMLWNGVVGGTSRPGGGATFSV
ncbi:MAG TPA: hypothetical protein VNL37_00215 [Candidatus Polarisedimenticolia bacterium]|nr:hypothetical protein [Candidatus Polarisedimenticolia bacterium]